MACSYKEADKISFSFFTPLLPIDGKSLRAQISVKRVSVRLLIFITLMVMMIIIELKKPNIVKNVVQQRKLFLSTGILFASPGLVDKYRMQVYKGATWEAGQQR